MNTLEASRLGKHIFKPPKQSRECALTATRIERDYTECDDKEGDWKTQNRMRRQGRQGRGLECDDKEGDYFYFRMKTLVTPVLTASRLGKHIFKALKEGPRLYVLCRVCA